MRQKIQVKFITSCTPDDENFSRNKFTNEKWRQMLKRSQKLARSSEKIAASDADQLMHELKPVPMVCPIPIDLIAMSPVSYSLLEKTFGLPSAIPGLLSSRKSRTSKASNVELPSLLLFAFRSCSYPRLKYLRCIRANMDIFLTRHLHPLTKFEPDRS